MGYGVLVVRASPRITNNVIAGNAVGGITLANPLDQPPAVRYNDVWNNGPAGAANYAGVADQTSNQGNVARDPLFVNPVAGDFHLVASSWARRAGEQGDELGAGSP
jgi:hypothetical protein